MKPTLFKRLAAEDRGATIVEYALIAALISGAIFGTVQGIAGDVLGYYQSAAAGFSDGS
jgi:Flp pilus assembly pilin Flp